MDRADLQATVAEAIRSRQRCVLAGLNLHGVYISHRDARMWSFYQRASHVYLDGMSLVLLGYLLGIPLRPKHRNTPIDWFPEVLENAAANGWRVFFLGSAPGVAARAAEELCSRFPGLRVSTEHGYFDATPGGAEAESVLDRIREWSPHILCVGMGMPRQEHWIVDYAERVDANVILNAGALIELLAGELSVPPRWVGRVGLEWLFRLVTHPRRVWRRYLVEPWFILPLFLRDLRSRRSKA